MNALDLEIRGPVHCYNGCYDSRTQATFDRQAAVLAHIQSVCPDAHCTYFPAEGYYMVHVWGWPVSGECRTKGAALVEAMEALRIGPFSGEEQA